MASPMLASLVALSALPAAGSTVVHTRFGSIHGREASAGGGLACEEFLGVPYAEPPARFEPPRAWKAAYGEGGLAADRYGAWCPQLDGAEVSGSENCLFLNVWRPRDTPRGSDLTLMVWIHGGGFVEGDAGDASMPNTYDGCGLAARHGVVVAGMNYRLGVLGFATLARAGGGVDANFGMEDQREALRWLRDQAAAFGADAAKLTIFGESAGGMSVFHHLASPRSAGLFRAAISESGLPTAVGREFGLASTALFARAAGCPAEAPVRDCLANKSAKELVEAMGSPTFVKNRSEWGPTVDGVELTDHPRRLLARGLSRAVPVLAGANTNEGNSFLWPEYPRGMNSSQYRAFITRLLTQFDPDQALRPAQLAEVFRRYPPAPDGDQRLQAAQVLSDYGILCGTQSALLGLSRAVDVYLYRFDHRPACPDPGPVPGTYHALELPYVFGTPRSYNCSFTGEERRLSERMQRFWTNFAKYLVPSSGDEAFPAFGKDRQLGLVLRTPSDARESRYRAGFCGFWSRIWQLDDQSVLLV